MTNSPSALTDQERAILEFEKKSWGLPLAKEQAIYASFGMSGPRYYQLLNDLINRQEALAADPLLVKRLRRLRASRREERSSQRTAGDVR